MATDSGVEEAQRAARLTEIAERVGRAIAQVSEPGVAEEFVTRYFFHIATADLLAVDVDTEVGLVAAHLRLGLERQPDEVKLAIFTPSVETTGWGAAGATVVQAVIPDRRFIVDTVIMTMTGLGWSIREVFHPQFGVERDEQGQFVDFVPVRTPEAARESWVCLEVVPTRRSTGVESAPELESSLRRALDLGAAAVADFGPMRRHMLAEIEALATVPPKPEITYATELLSWLATDNFVFLGYQEYSFDGQFHVVPGTGLGICRGDPDAPGNFHAFPDAEHPLTLVITKDTHFSPVHRRAYLEYIGIRRFDETGRVVGEARFLGQFASSAYIESVYRIPGLRTKAEQLLAMSSFAPDSHGRALLERTIATYPRDELFQATATDLFPIVKQVSLMRERRQVRVFLRPSTYQQFVSVAVYLPRDRYVTSVRHAIQNILLEALGGLALDHQVHLTESIMARLFFVIRVPNTDKLRALDVAELEARIAAACRNWHDEFTDAAADLPSEELDVEFTEAYQADYTAAQAVLDLKQLNRLVGDDDLELSLFPDEGEADCRLKVFTASPMSLAAAMPHLSALGVAVVDERPHDVVLRGRELRVYDFRLRVPGGSEAFAAWPAPARRRFVEAFEASYRGLTECDQLNALVVQGGLSWRQVSWLRAISRYLQQANVPYSQTYIAAALKAQAPLAIKFVELFTAKFDPGSEAGDPARRDEVVADLRAEFLAGLDTVTSLDHDRILRMFDKVLAATVRTNAFADRQALALKLLPAEINFLPEPRPEFEIFVHSPRVTGTHLRFGKVARGGLRWSDRVEDFRTEVLGLVKAQLVKNSVIVPGGAKGGFVPLRLPPASAGREAVQAEGMAAYKLFISSLLAVTDNIVDGRTVTPERVVAHDDPDPYLVVAADKGTASFSDLANEISLEHGFWLGDAFASGGSAGYDHKAMGITARGAWESVKQHFAEMDVDCQTTDFTAVGIGDMAGDVFGNGMLRSRHTRLVAAFNHMHIFIDPDPDPAASFDERQRLFDTPRSTWADYNRELISPGGGVFERSAKAITLSAEAKQVLGIDPEVTSLTPAELISAILCAPVDLLFNGGIGTYVKATTEAHLDVGDRANDAVRVNGSQVRARCVGEGGNLGWTQLGRIEYALAGGRINADFIDNSGGVDTSDHEVNIKILMGAAIKADELEPADRDELLTSMTDEVAELVLGHNVAQNLILSDAEGRARDLVGAHESWMSALEALGTVDRELDALPSTEEMAARGNAGRGLTRPELAVLLASTKLLLKSEILASDLPDDPYLGERLVTYFPWPLRERFRELMPKHRLHREIVTTVTVNRFIDTQGITAYHRLSQETGSDAADVIRGQLAARALVDAAVYERRLSESGATAIAQTKARVELRRMVERTSRVLLHTRRWPIDIAATIKALKPGDDEVRELLPGILTPRFAVVAAKVTAEFADLGFADDLATVLGSAQFAHFATGIVQIPRGEVPLATVAAVFFDVAERLSLDVLYDQIDELPRTGRWDTMARAALRDDLLRLLGSLTAAVIAGATGTESPDELCDSWLARTPRGATKVQLLAEIMNEDSSLAQVAVGLRQARSLVQGEE